MISTNSILEHEPHIGANYGSSPDGRRILIVGHSHHKKPEEADCSEFTTDCVEKARDGGMQRFPFFARQPKYLHLDRRQYYDQIALINFAPEAVDSRYKRMTPEQEERGRERLKTLIEKIAPTHVFVTTPKVEFGKQLPPTDEEKRGEPLQMIEIEGEQFRWGTYTSGDTTTLCCRLPHPQAARTTLMQEAFSKMLGMSA